MAAVTALVLVAGATAGLIALRDSDGTGGGGSPGGGTTSTAPRQPGEETARSSPDPVTGSTGPAVPYPTEESPSPRTTCGGGWVTSC